MVQMSVDASFHPGYGDQNNHVMNGDGFGVGWYHNNTCIDKSSENRRLQLKQGIDYSEGQRPRLAAVFKDVLPAWNNTNLKEICQATYSDCIMAHVRAASKGSGVSQQNCHPFKTGRLLFCHNGRIDSFLLLRRRYHALLSDEAYMGVRGTTDSEFIFALILTVLASDGKSSGESPLIQSKPFGHSRLISAIKKVLKLIEEVQVEAGLLDGFNTCNFSLTDGETMVVTRYCDKSPAVPAPSLYFAYGEAHDLYGELTDEEQQPAALISSHPSSVDLDKTYGKQKSSSGSDGDDNNSQHSTEDEEDVERVKLKYALSTPGRIFADIDPKTACLVVCSTPLSRTHSWHRIPANAILFYTRGSFPELRLLRTPEQRA